MGTSWRSVVGLAAALVCFSTASIAQISRPNHLDWTLAPSDDARVDYFWAAKSAINSRRPMDDFTLITMEFWKMKKPETSKDQAGVEYQVHALRHVRDYDCTNMRSETKQSWIVLSPEILENDAKVKPVGFRPGNPHLAATLKEGTKHYNLIRQLCERL